MFVFSFNFKYNNCYINIKKKLIVLIIYMFIFSLILYFIILKIDYKFIIIIFSLQIILFKIFSKNFEIYNLLKKQLL